MISKTPLENFENKINVVGAFVEHDGKIVLLHRQDHKPQGNTWGAPAGKVDKGEATLDAMIREINEEIGLKVSSKDLIFVAPYYVRHEGRDILYHQYHLILEKKPDLILNPNEHKDHIWITPEEALRLNLIHDEDMCIKWVYKMV